MSNKIKIIIIILVLLSPMVIISIYGWNKFYKKIEFARIDFLIKGDSTNAELYSQRIKLADKYFKKGVQINYLDNEVLSNYDYDINKYIELGGKEGFIYKYKGIDLMSQDRGKAIQYFTQAIQYGDNSYVFRGMGYMDIGEYELAINDFQKDTELDSTRSNNYFKAICYSILGNYEQSISLFKKDRSYEYYVEQLMSFNKFTEAIVYQDSISKLLSGLINYQTGNYNSAKIKLNYYIKNAPEDYTAEYLLSKVYLHEGDKVNALNHLELSFKKGFGFFDILNKDYDYSKILGDIRYKKMILKYKNESNRNIPNIINKILKQKSISKNDEYHLVNHRRYAILVNSFFKSEYQKLNELSFKYLSNYKLNAP